ncbi:terminase small subunit [Ralstonia phage Reminis]|uniref:Terminase small subunit n=1 Tax=Ralstonia phage Reminis TaxID=2662139 RepID=A0A5Q2UA14_9CAUD|nr:terminase small subunit [Ralstonia phage Reminis]
MALVAKGNKKAATEDEIGVLHFMVTQIFKRKLGKWLELMEQGADPELIVDMKQLNNVIKFIGDNGVVCQDPAAESRSELGDQINEIKRKQEERLNRSGNVVPFTDEDDYSQFG